MKLITLICAGCVCASLVAASTAGLERYRRLESYEVRPGIVATPIYSPGGEVCEVSIEKRHYSNDTVDLDAAMSRKQVLQLFDELAPQAERGRPGLNLPEGTEIGEIDGGTRTEHILYKNVSLTMYGEAKSQKFVTAIITWKKQGCHQPRAGVE